MLSKRRAIALDKSSVKKKLSLPCSCAKNCQKQFSVQEILYWRQRIHCIPAGEERIKKTCRDDSVVCYNNQKIRAGFFVQN